MIIARALAQEPPLLLLDEPTTHLDISHKLDLMDMMVKLNTKQNLTIVGVFHDLNLAARYCRRLIIMHRGRKIADGPLEDVLTPDNLNRVFRINTIVRRNPITNSLFIEPLTTITPSSRKSTENEDIIKKKGVLSKKIHIICGAGTGTDLMKSLVDDGFSISAGVLNVLDQDHQTAESLNIPIVSEAAFSPISPKSHKTNIKLITSSDIIILTNVPFGTANQLNMDAFEHGLKIGKKLFIYDPSRMKDVEKRDFTGGEVFKKYLKISKKADIKYSLDDFISVLLGK